MGALNVTISVTSGQNPLIVLYADDARNAELDPLREELAAEGIAYQNCHPQYFKPREAVKGADHVYMAGYWPEVIRYYEARDIPVTLIDEPLEASPDHFQASEPTQNEYPQRIGQSNWYILSNGEKFQGSRDAAEAEEAGLEG